MNLLEVYRSLDIVDLRILRVIEVEHKRYEFVPHRLLERRIGERTVRIRELHRLGLLRRKSQLGWRITSMGYDILALHALRGKIAKLSPAPIGVGKDSVVYAGEMPSGFRIAVKFHRGTMTTITDYIRSARASASAEFFALERVFEAGGLVPEPISLNRHVVVMSYIDGMELYRCRKDVLNDILYTMKIALNLGIVHGDLSPYNILVTDRGYIIDWPQWISLKDPRASNYLKRDIDNIANFFKIEPSVIYKELINTDS